jgi:hypothetical protein
VRWIVLLLGLEFPALLALLDCTNRPDEHFAGGAPDKKGWKRWLLIAVATAWIGVGDGIVLGYYYAVVRRNTPARP